MLRPRRRSGAVAVDIAALPLRRLVGQRPRGERKPDKWPPLASSGPHLNCHACEPRAGSRNIRTLPRTPALLFRPPARLTPPDPAAPENRVDASPSGGQHTREHADQSNQLHLPLRHGDLILYQRASSRIACRAGRRGLRARANRARTVSSLRAPGARTQFVCRPAAGHPATPRNNAESRRVAYEDIRGRADCPPTAARPGYLSTRVTGIHRFPAHQDHHVSASGCAAEPCRSSLDHRIVSSTGILRHLRKCGMLTTRSGGRAARTESRRPASCLRYGATGRPRRCHDCVPTGAEYRRRCDPAGSAPSSCSRTDRGARGPRPSRADAPARRPGALLRCR